MNILSVRAHPFFRIMLPALLLLLSLLTVSFFYSALSAQRMPPSSRQAAAVIGAGAPFTATTALTSSNSLTAIEPLSATVRAIDEPTEAATAPPTATLTPFVVTATATPESVLAAATVVAALTADALISGTATATPENMVLATNTPTPQVVTNTPTPANAATLEARLLEETAIAFTTGTSVPRGPIITATPTETPAPPATPAPTNTAPPTPSATWTAIYVTPTPPAADLYRAATAAVQATRDATTTGTATPLPVNWKVAGVRVLPYEPAAANEATATALAIDATARAVTTGEPLGVVYWTATPRPPNTLTPTLVPTATPTPADTPTPTDTPFVVTATETPASVLAAATLVAQMTSDAATTGTATSLPRNALLATNTPKPIVVTSTPTAENAATAAAMLAEATAIAFTTGEPATDRFVTATPTAPRVATARPTNTPTPIYVPLADLTLTPTAEATPRFPTELVGKILFLANLDQRGAPEAYAMEADGSNVLRLSSREFYDRAAERDHTSADRRFYTFVRRETGGADERQIFAYDAFYQAERQLTHFGDGSTSWDPAWSPTTELVAFVSNGSGNDEIWTIGRADNDPVKLTDNDKLWDRHPSFSPDGTRIVFESNRSGQLEVWVMDQDGGNPQQLTTLAVPSGAPVWVKYGDQ